MCDYAALCSPRTIARRRACEQAFPGRRDRVRAARALMAAFLGDFPAAGDVILLVSELAANACAHTASGSPGGIFIVRAALCPALFVHAEVEDQGSTSRGTGISVPPQALMAFTCYANCPLTAAPAGGGTAGSHGSLSPAPPSA